nr:unnamed protein product [Leishmania braziliensis]
MESPPAQAVSGEQRARLLELEERQRQLKRLCEEALREEEQHQHILQQLEEHNTGAVSSVESFAGGSAGSVSGSAALQGGRFSPNHGGEPLEDLLTGEVQSFRDPNSAVRESSTGSAAAPLWLRSESLSNPRNPSADRPRTALSSSYRPPTYPLPMVFATQSPPPPREMLYSTSSRPREEGSSAAVAAMNRRIQPPTSAPVMSSSLPITSAWRHGERGTAERKSGSNSAAAALFPPAAPTPLSPPPPPPPPPERSHSRGASHSIPSADRYWRSDARPYHGIPPPPPPPASDATQATASPSAVRYSWTLRAHTSLSPPRPPLSSRSSALPLVSPDEVTDNPPAPPPRTHRRAAPSRDMPPSMADTYRWPPSLLHTDSPPPPPPPPPPSPPAARTDPVGDSTLPTTPSERDIARWRRRLSGSGAVRPLSDNRPGSGYDRSGAATLANRRAPPAAVTPLLSVPYRETATKKGVRVAGRAPRSLPPPPPPPAPSVTLFSPARYGEGRNEDESLPDRWETASLTPSLRSAEERCLRNYFAKPVREVGSSSPTHRNYASYSRQRASPSCSGVKGVRTSLFEVAGTAEPRLQRRSTVIPTPDLFTSSAPTVMDTPPPAPVKPKPNKSALHPYELQHPQSPSLSPPPETSLNSTSARNCRDAPGHRGDTSTPLLSALYAKHQQATSATLKSSNLDSARGNGDISLPANLDMTNKAATGAPHTAAAASANDYFDMGPEKEALLSLLQESTRGAPGSNAGAALPATSCPSSIQQGMSPAMGANLAGGRRGEKALPYPLSANCLSERNQTQIFSTQPPMTTLPPHYKDPTAQHSYLNPTVDSSILRGGNVNAATRGVQHSNEVAAVQLQQKYDEAQAKAEALARHLVKAISDRKMLQGSVEQLEMLVEECNIEVGRLQQIVEQQHQDSATSLGVQAALRAKEREVAVYEDEIRRLHVVLNGHLTRTATAERVAQESVHQGLVVKEAEVEAAIAEVGMAHLAQREAEERASQLANELDTAVEQIQFLDERLAEMERAAAAALLPASRVHAAKEPGVDSDSGDAALAHSSAAAHLTIPPDEETRRWPLEARRTMAQLVAQAEGLLLKNAEGERHTSMRLQHMENTCSELQRHLRQRSEEVERAREAYEQLRQEKSTLQTVGEVWYQQLREVKEDAQLVSEMVRTSREDAEDVYLSSRVAEERAVVHRAAAAAASPLRPFPSSAPTDSTTLKKSAQFARQVMRDFHAVARFLSSLRTMNIGDRNGYQILQTIASGRNPAEGLYVTADDAATPKRVSELLAPNAASEAKRRVQEKKARVLRAVEQALIIGSDSAPEFASLDASEKRPPSRAPIMLGLPLRARERPSPAGAEVCEVPDAFEDELTNGDEAEVEVVFSSLHPTRMGSQSLRDGSSGMVHSDVRRRPASDSVASVSQNRMPPTSEIRRAAPAFAASPPAAPLAPDGKSFCSTLFTNSSEAPSTASTSQPTAVKAAPAPPTPLPSVSRPLRLSNTPSQPQSEGKEENEEEALGPSEKHSSSIRASSHTVLRTDSMPICSTGAGIDSETHSITLVPLPSIPQQVPQLQTTTVQQAPLPPSTLTVTGGLPVDHIVVVSSSTAPFVSGIVMTDQEKDASVARRNAPTLLQMQQQHTPIPATLTNTPPSSSRLRSPTPDRLPAVWAGTHVDEVLIASPIEQRRSSQSFTDEPPPRVVCDENKQLGHLCSRPKNRSTTARPSSTPHPDSRSGTRRGFEARAEEETVAPPRHTDQHRRGASNRSNDDEATLFFREPPRGEVQEVASEATSTSLQEQQQFCVEVDLLNEDFVMPSRRVSAAAVALASVSSVSPETTLIDEEEEADVEERVPSAGTAATRPSLRAESPLKRDHTAAPSVPDVGLVPLKDAKATKPSSSRNRRVVDEDDEPSLSFLAPPPPLPPPVRPSPSQVQTKRAQEEDALVLTSPTEASLSGTSYSQTMEDTSGAAVSTENVPHSPLSLCGSFAGAPLRLPHQPRRPSASDGHPSLTAVEGAVAPPRLQRSTGSSPLTAAQPLLGTFAPGPAAAGDATAGVSQRIRSGSRPPTARLSVDCPLLEATPALVEPRRHSPSARPVPTATHTNPVTPVDTVDFDSPSTAGLSPLEEQTSPAPKKAQISRAHSEVDLHVDDLLRSDGKVGAKTTSSTPTSRLPSITSTAAPGSPQHVLEEPSVALGLPGEICNDTPGQLASAVSLPAEALQAAPLHPREPPTRAGHSASPCCSPHEEAAPAPLPLVNADAPESSALNLPYTSPKPAPPMAEAATFNGNRPATSPAVAQMPSSTISTPRSHGGGRQNSASVWSSTPAEQPMPDGITARRCEEVAKILMRLKAKKEQDSKQPSEMSTPTSPTESEPSSTGLEDLDSPSS